FCLLERFQKSCRTFPVGKRDNTKPRACAPIRSERTCPSEPFPAGAARNVARNLAGRARNEKAANEGKSILSGYKRTQSRAQALLEAVAQLPIGVEPRFAAA